MRELSCWISASGGNRAKRACRREKHALIAIVVLATACGGGRAGGPGVEAGLDRSTPSPVAASTPDPGPPVVPMLVEWRYAMRHFEVMSYAPTESAAPIVDGDRLYASSARGASMYALDAATGNPIWTYRTRGRVESTPAIGGERIYIADAKGRLHGIKRSDGSPIWRVELGGLPTGRVLRHDDGIDRVVVATIDNRVHARNGVNGGELWTYRRDPPADLSIYGTSSPVHVTSSAGDAYVVGFSDGSIVALRPANGTVLWETRLVSSGRFRDVDGTVLQVGDRLYVTTYGDELVALDAATGKTQWSATPGGATGITVADGRLYHGVDTGEVIARDPADGREIWRWKLPAGVPTTPIPAGEFIFVASSSRSIYAIRAANGTLAWSYEPGWNVSGSWAAPAVSGSRVFFTSNVGTVYSFRPAGNDIHYIGTWDSGARR